MSSSLFPARSVAFQFNGQNIRCREDDMVSLSEIWYVSGAPEGGRPLEWAQGAGSGFVDHIAGRDGRGKPQVVKAYRGDGAEETIAHWEIGLTYGFDISPSFSLSMTEPLDGKAIPGTRCSRVIEVYRRQCGDAIRVVR